MYYINGELHPDLKSKIKQHNDELIRKEKERIKAFRLKKKLEGGNSKKHIERKEMSEEKRKQISEQRSKKYKDKVDKIKLILLFLSKIIDENYNINDYEILVVKNVSIKTVTLNIKHKNGNSTMLEAPLSLSENDTFEYLNIFNKNYISKL